MSYLPDCALEASRRVAWARYYAARRDSEAVRLWAAELAEWLDQLDVELPAVALDLIGAVRASLARDDAAVVRRFVTFHLASTAA